MYMYFSVHSKLHVTGSNLTGACKLVFKVARNERNDYLFANIDVAGSNVFNVLNLHLLKV